MSTFVEQVFTATPALLLCECPIAVWRIKQKFCDVGHLFRVALGFPDNARYPVRPDVAVRDEDLYRIGALGNIPCCPYLEIFATYAKTGVVCRGQLVVDGFPFSLAELCECCGGTSINDVS